jgi:hypothetical protein
MQKQHLVQCMMLNKNAINKECKSNLEPAPAPVQTERGGVNTEATTRIMDAMRHNSSINICMSHFAFHTSRHSIRYDPVGKLLVSRTHFPN